MPAHAEQLIGPALAPSLKHVIVDQREIHIAVTAGSSTTDFLMYANLSKAMHLIANKSTLAATVVPEVENGEAEEDMVSLRRDDTGVDNTIFVSTNIDGRHAARIKIAVDPPDSLNPRAKTVSMAIHDYTVRGDGLTSEVAAQARQFIDHNRDLLLKYWNYEIATKELTDQVTPPP